MSIVHHVYNMTDAYMYICIHVLMRDEKKGRKKQARSNKHSTPTFPKKNELPRVGLKTTTFYTLDSALHVYTCKHLQPNKAA